MEQLTLDNVKTFLKNAHPQSIVGQPMSPVNCLVAKTLMSLYPDCDPVVWYTNTYAWITINDSQTLIQFAPEVTEVANKFDNFPGKYMQLVTRQELEEYMPELFEEEK